MAEITKKDRTTIKSIPKMILDRYPEKVSTIGKEIKIEIIDNDDYFIFDGECSYWTKKDNIIS